MATYYIHIDTYYADSPDTYVGPFESKPEANRSITDSQNETGSQVVFGGQPSDMRNAIRVYGVLSKTQAKKQGMKSYGEGDHSDNTISSMPKNTSELHQMTNMEF